MSTRDELANKFSPKTTNVWPLEQDCFKEGFYAAMTLPQLTALISAIEVYRNECETVAPDALYKRECREKVFTALDKFKAATASK